jgi:hypothetical protein
MKRFDWRRMFSRAAGGSMPQARENTADRVPFMLAPGEEITDPDQAEAVGLTVEAKRMRATSPPG